MGKAEQRIGLRHVAKRAGVSISTASNVFADKPWIAVSSETRAAVLAAAEELGYRPRPHTEYGPNTVTALGIVGRSTHSLPTNPFYSHVFHGAEQACTARGIGLMYSSIDEQSSNIEQIPVMLQRHSVQGLLVAGPFTTGFFALLDQIRLPFVMIDHHMEPLLTDSITCDDEYGGYLATKYLLERGHTNPPPAIISGPEAIFSVHARYQGYRRALLTHGLHYDETYNRQGNLNLPSGYSAMNTLLDLERPPTAVFCCNDSMALGALNALRDRGIPVPDSCSIIGYDDITLATHTTPSLTTIRVEKEWLGQLAVWNLLERIANPEIPPRHIKVGVTLVERQSVQTLSHDRVAFNA